MLDARWLLRLGSVNDPGDDGVADPDPQCVDRPWMSTEGSARRCGLGWDLVLVLPALMWLRRRRTPAAAWAGADSSSPSRPAYEGLLDYNAPRGVGRRRLDAYLGARE
jgi:hypothetical protein